jgi:hypothetical protein
MIKSRRMRWTGHVAHIGLRNGVYRVLVRKPESKRPLGRFTCDTHYNINPPKKLVPKFKLALRCKEICPVVY